MTIIDLGALTNDLTTVIVNKNDPTLELTEAATPNGGKCGTSAIHCRLLAILEEKFLEAFREIPDAQVKRGSRFFEACERLLRRFDGKRLNRTYSVPLKLPEGFRHEDYDFQTFEVKLKA